MQFLKQRQFFWGAQKLYTKCCTVCNWFIHSFIHSFVNNFKFIQRPKATNICRTATSCANQESVERHCSAVRAFNNYCRVHYSTVPVRVVLVVLITGSGTPDSNVQIRDDSKLFPNYKKRHCTLQNMEGQSPWDPDIETQHTVKLVRTRFPRILQHIRYYHLFFGHIYDWIFMRVPCAKA